MFPPSKQRLDIVEAAGIAIPVGGLNAVSITLSVGSPETQIVKVQGMNFSEDTPITVAVTPENGPSSRYEGIILKPATGNTSIASVEVSPVDTVCHVHWAKAHRWEVAAVRKAAAAILALRSICSQMSRTKTCAALRHRRSRHRSCRPSWAVRQVGNSDGQSHTRAEHTLPPLALSRGDWIHGLRGFQDWRSRQ